MKNKKVRRRIRIYLIVILAIISILSFRLYYYWPKIFENYKQTKHLQETYESLLFEEETLRSDVIKLKDDEYLARFAREKYLYSKDGEIIIRINE